MVDSLWFVLALVLLAVVSVALVLVLVLRREEAHGGRATRTEYLQPNYGQTGGFRVSSAPSNETIISYRYWLIEGQVSEIDRLRHCAGPPHEPAHGQDRADALPRRLF